jgi:hypothetical protein
MPDIRQLAEVVNNAQLNTLFQTCVRRAANRIVIGANSTPELREWAVRANFTFGQDRVPWYATKIIEGALTESAEFRDQIDADLGDPSAVKLSEQQFDDLVQTWALRFAAMKI